MIDLPQSSFGVFYLLCLGELFSWVFDHGFTFLKLLYLSIWVLIGYFINERSFLLSQKVLCASFPSLKVSSLQSRVMAYLCDFYKQQRQNPEALRCLMAQIKNVLRRVGKLKCFQISSILGPSHLGFIEKYELHSQEEFFSAFYAWSFFNLMKFRIIYLGRVFPPPLPIHYAWFKKKNLG